MKLTGRTRYRVEKKCFRKALVVLQVEETGHTYDYCGGYFERQDITQWRDAKVEDLMVTGKLSDD